MLELLILTINIYTNDRLRNLIYHQNEQMPFLTL